MGIEVSPLTTRNGAPLLLLSFKSPQPQNPMMTLHKATPIRPVNCLRKGAVLISVITVMVIVGVLGVAVISLTQSSQHSSFSSNASSRAYYLAESGLRYAQDIYCKEGWPDGSQRTLSLENGEKIEVVREDDTFWATAIVDAGTARARVPMPLCLCGHGAGPAPVNLGSAGDFVILTKSGITNNSTSAITGDIGTSPFTGAFMTGLTQSQVMGNIYSVDAAGPAGRITDPTKLTSAVLAMEAAYTDAAGRPTPDFMELGAGDISGLTLTPGLYKWGTTVTVPTDVTFSGGPNDVWILQVAGTLTVGNAVAIQLAGGAQAKNIFWQVADAITIGTTARFEGTILAQTSIAIQPGATINGRLFAQTAVTLQMNTVTKPE